MNWTIQPQDVLAAMAFYIIPFFIGSGVTGLLKIVFKKEPSKNLFELIISNFISFMTGSVLIYGTALIIHQQPALKSNFLGNMLVALQIWGGSAVILNLIYFIRNLRKSEHYIKRISKELAIIPLFFVLGAGIYAIWKVGSPSYTTLNWDIFHQQTLAHSIANGNFDYSTAKLSDSFQFEGYSSMFHLLLAIPQIIFRPNILNFWWCIEYLHLIVTLVASYLIAYSVTKSKKISLLGMLFGAFFFESEGAYTSLFLIPQNLAATVTVVVIAKIIYEATKYDEILAQKSIPLSKNTLHPEPDNKLKLGTLVSDATIPLFIVYIMLNHYIIGILGIFLVFVSMIFVTVHQQSKPEKIENILVLLAFLVLIVFPIITAKFDFSFINRGEAAYFNLSNADKLKFIKNVYGYSIFMLLPLGMFYCLKQKEFQYKLTGLLLFGTTALFVAPLPYTTKFYSIERYFVDTAMALGFWFLIKRSHIAVKAVSTGLLTLVLLIVFTTNVVKYKQVPTYKDIYTHISPNEVAAAMFLKDHYTGANVLLVSEPATMHVLEGISGINTPGGAYAGTETRQILTDIYYSRDSALMTRKIFEIKDKLETQEPGKILLAIDGRFTKWEEADEAKKMGIYWNVWTPFDLSPTELESYSFIDFAETHANFREIYKNNGIVILEASRPAQ